MSKTLILSILYILLLTPSHAQKQNKGLAIHPLVKNCYVYTTYGYLDDGSRFPSNSMYVVTGKGIVMIDVPWDTAQTERFLRRVEKQHGKKVVACISTHFHEDRTAGLDILKRHGIRTYSTTLTAEYCHKQKKQEAAYLMAADTVFDMGNCHIQTYYPGKGHAPDNIVVWIPEYKILYGGCFVKSDDAGDLGNLGDASPEEWPASVANVQRKFPGARYIIPGHGEGTSPRSLEHTLELLRKYAQKKTR